MDFNLLKRSHSEVFGAVSIAEKTQAIKLLQSVFESFKKDNKTGEYITSIKIPELLQNTNAKCVILSYSSSGRTNKKSLQKILNALNYNFLFYEFDYKKNIMHSLQSTNATDKSTSKNKEYLIIIDESHALNLEKLGQQFLAMIAYEGTPLCVIAQRCLFKCLLAMCN